MADSTINQMVTSLLNTLSKNQIIMTHSHVGHLAPKDYYDQFEARVFRSPQPEPKIWDALVQGEINGLTVNYVPVASLLGRADYDFGLYLESMMIPVDQIDQSLVGARERYVESQGFPYEGYTHQ